MWAPGAAAGIPSAAQRECCLATRIPPLPSSPAHEWIFCICFLPKASRLLASSLPGAFGRWGVEVSEADHAGFDMCHGACVKKRSPPLADPVPSCWAHGQLWAAAESLLQAQRCWQGHAPGAASAWIWGTHLILKRQGCSTAPHALADRPPTCFLAPPVLGDAQLNQHHMPWV